MSTSMTQSVQAWSRRPAAKVAAIGALLLLMLLPSTWVEGVIGEREARQDAVREDIARSWGPAQSVLGPILVVPYRFVQPAATGPQGQVLPATVVRRYVHIVPQRLAVEARLSPERRRRGLFGTIVYGADLALEGSFNVPALAIPGIPQAEILWAESVVVAGASDLRAAGEAPLRWNESDLPASDDPPAGGGCGAMAFLSWPLATAPSPGQTIAFSTRMTLRGTGGLHLVPAARQLNFSVAAPWATPSFTGAVLPSEQTVTDTGFTARWQDAGGARQAVWFGDAPMTCSGPAAATYDVLQQDGVDLLEAVPTYRMVNRTAKYALLFLALGFLTYFLFETLSGLAIHLVQYGLLGLSICLFPLLLLAFAEPLGFALSYAIASSAVVLQASLFTWSVTKRARLAAVFAGVISTVFGFLYVVLSLESLSLLVGTLALFAILSVVMAVTRRVDWGQAA